MNWRLLKLSLLTRRLSVRSLVLGLLVAVGVSALATTPASAQVGSWVTDKIGVSLAQIFGWVLLLLIYVVGYLTIVLTKIFSWAVTYSDFIYNGTVAIGWEIVRDFCNMFFVVAILAIAWATILQLESYGYRRLLLKLMLMAVLINFSKLICGAIIDLGQIMILTFAQATVGGIEVSNLFIKLGVGDLTSFTGVIDNQTTASQAFNLVGTLLFGFVLLVIIFGLILAYTVIFAFRIVALWILIILSPLAFLLAAFPVGSGYSRQWWQSFTKYVFSGVVIMFFFWLALVTSEQALTILSPELASEQQNSLLGVTSSRMGSPINLSRFIITASFLIAGLMAAQRAGVAGSDFAGDVLQRLRRAPGQLGRFAYRSSRDTYAWGARKIKAGEVPFGLGKYTLGLDLNVANWVRGFKESRSEKKYREEAVGKFYSGDALHRGGWAGTFKGLGVGRDFFDAYAKGFLNIQGFRRMYGAVTGGEPEAEKVFKQVEHEKKNEARLRAEADEKEALAKRKDFFEEGIEEYVEEELKSTAPGSRLSMIRAERETLPGDPVSDAEMRYRKEFLKSQGFDDSKDKSEIDRLSQLDVTDKEYLVHFGSEKWKEFVGEKDKDVAHKQLRSEAKAMSVTGTVDERDRLMQLGQQRLRRERDRAEDDVDRMRAGFFVGDELQKREGELNGLLDELEKIESAILRSGSKPPWLVAKQSKIEVDIAKIAKKNAAGKWEVDADPRDEKIKEENFNKYRVFKEGETSADSLLGKAIAKMERRDRELQSVRYTEEEREQLREEAQRMREQAEVSKKKQVELKEKAAAMEAPKAFYADEGYQALIREQMGKIHGENAEELNAAFRSAQRDGDKIKAAAIAYKMAQDANDNELWNEFGFDSTAQGKHDFFDAVMIGKKGVKRGDGTVYDGLSFGMSEQEAYGLENAIDYINESIGHWETARTMKVEGGIFKRMDERDHALNALAEIMKRNPREVARSFNRLAYGGERVTNMATGAREFLGPTALGKGILMALGPEIWKQGLDRGEYNKNAVVNLGKWMETHGGATTLRGHNIDERYIRKLDEIYALEKVRGTTGASDTIARLFREAL